MPRPRSRTIGNDKDIQCLQKQVEVTVDIMHHNVHIAGERFAALDDLIKRGDMLHEKTQHFAKSTHRIQKQERRKNVKTKILIIIAVTVPVCILIGIVIYGIAKIYW